MTAPIIRIENLKKIYNNGAPVTALNNISFLVKKGEFLAIMGPSGSGKSTLLHILGVLDKSTDGNYWLDNKNINDYSEEYLAKLRNKKLGFVFQAFNLLPRTSVLDNVCLPLMYAGYKPSQQKEMAEKAIKKVGLEHRLRHDPSQLSGGEKQRVAIARALVTEPDVILADEPTGNLDSKSSEQIMTLIKNLHQEGKTILIITHDEEIAQYAKRVIKIKDGVIESDEYLTNY